MISPWIYIVNPELYYQKILFVNVPDYIIEAERRIFALETDHHRFR